ncbi:MAG: hypothetical protein BWX81_01994 [Spirochaetes bacterium ADurb.Bin110]|nr:MAG: hypothetical protein BWX81_01994 [Spirochaetes bacterium ADurb.Bin110]
MEIELRILHLCRSLDYIFIEEPRIIEAKTLSDILCCKSELLLEFEEEGLSTMTDDGPKLFDKLEPSAVYRLADSKYSETEGPKNPNLERASLFSLDIGKYIFCQQDMDYDEEAWRLKSLLEEAIREVWWQRVKCEGSWFLRLVPEDDRVAVQALKKMRPE